MYSIRELNRHEWPEFLKNMPSPPKKLYIAGTMPPLGHIYLTIVGSRKYTDYGKSVCETLIRGLAGLPVVIVSGLAYGIDRIAHESAIDNGLATIAIPGSGLGEKSLYPSYHRALAMQIIEKGGALISPFESDMRSAPWTFPSRNRIMAGISHATLVIEADIKSGTLITSKFAGDFNRDVLAVPGSIFSSQSEGPHMLIKIGATPITCADDLKLALGFNKERLNKEKTSDELEIPAQIKIDFSEFGHLSDICNLILKNMTEPINRDVLFNRLKQINISDFNSALSILEIKGLIRESIGQLHKITTTN